MEFVLAMSARGCSGPNMCSSTRTEQKSSRLKWPEPQVMPTKPAGFVTMLDLKQCCFKNKSPDLYLGTVFSAKGHWSFTWAAYAMETKMPPIVKSQFGLHPVTNHAQLFHASWIFAELGVNWNMQRLQNRMLFNDILNFHSKVARMDVLKNNLLPTYSPILLLMWT